MTISTTTTRVTYTGNGVTTAFAVPFVFFGSSEITVIEKEIATGVETTKTLTTHYTVSGGNGSTGTVTAVSAPSSSYTWTIARATARTQLVDYVSNDSFPAETHERALDRVVAVVQEAQDAADRSLKISATSSLSNLVLPPPGASEYLRWNSGGTAIETAAIVLTGTVATATETTAGIAEIATQSEANTGTDDIRAMTPLKTRVANIIAIVVSVTSDTSALTTGTAKRTFRMPYAFTLTAVRASLVTAQTSGTLVTVDINDNGTTILSTKLTIDNTEKTSVTAATPAVISDTALADDAEITIDVDAIGDGTAKGLKVALIGYRT